MIAVSLQSEPNLGEATHLCAVSTIYTPANSSKELSRIGNTQARADSAPDAAAAPNVTRLTVEY
jgi:hypothetical protein